MAKVMGVSLVGLVLVTVCILVLAQPVENVTVDFQSYYADSKPLDLFLAEQTRMMQASLFMDVGTTYSHAEQKHPGVKSCMEGNDVIQVWENPFSGHCAEVIKIDDNNFVIRIVAKIKGRFEEITAFTDNVEGLWEVEEYLIDGSYMQIWGYP